MEGNDGGELQQEAVEITPPPSSADMSEEQLEEVALNLTGNPPAHLFDKEDTAAILRRARQYDPDVNGQESIQLQASDDEEKEEDEEVLYEDEEERTSEDDDETMAALHMKQAYSTMRRWEESRPSVEYESTFTASILTLLNLGVSRNTDRKMLQHSVGNLFASITMTEEAMTAAAPLELTEEARSKPAALLDIIAGQQKEITHQRNFTRYVNHIMLEMVTYAQLQYKDQLESTDSRRPLIRVPMAQRVRGQQGPHPPVSVEYQQLPAGSQSSQYRSGSNNSLRAEDESPKSGRGCAVL